MAELYSPTDTMIDVIRERMLADGRTQREFAADLGISPKHLSEVFNGWADPSFKLLDKMLEFLGLDLRVVSRDY